MSPLKRQSIQAEISLVQLKNCLVNLPPTLVAALLNANTTAQDVIVELQSKEPPAREPGSSNNQRSVYVGWTGMPSKRNANAIVGKGSGRSGLGGEMVVPSVEIDATFGRTVGLAEGQKVGVLLHLNPSLATTVNIEPLTPGDWEMIELHSNFLELNLLSQIRALPNPSFAASPSTQAQQAHPLTIHLTPTSTANVLVISLSPPPPGGSPFAKISPEAEVIVAPKTRQRPSRNITESRSIASTSRRSAGARNGVSGARQRSHRGENYDKHVYLRGIAKSFCNEWFDEEDEYGPDPNLKAWIDPDVLAGKELGGTRWACISIVRPTSLAPPIDPQYQQKLKDQEGSDAGKPNFKVVAQLLPWDNAPDARHISLSKSLCTTLNAAELTGGLVRVEVAPPQAPKNTLKSLKIYPFASSTSKKNEGFRFGGESKANREEAAGRIRIMYEDKTPEALGLFQGPLTDGQIMPKLEDDISATTWDGGLIRFDSISSDGRSEQGSTRWILGSEFHINVDIQTEIPNPLQLRFHSAIDADRIPSCPPLLIGIDKLVMQLLSHLSHGSSVLLTGGLGSGKTSVAQFLAYRLRESQLYSTVYFCCSKLVTDETRISTIKETMNRLFMQASWGTRLGGHAIVVLDDWDKLCPVEAELQIGGDNTRSRQISEMVCSTIRQYCGIGSRVVLLATAQSKEGLNNVIVGGHVIREIVSLKVPDKDGRRQVLQSLILKDSAPTGSYDELPNGNSSHDKNAWMDSPSTRGPPSSRKAGFVFSSDLDFLSLAAQTDGYMPGDLVLLVSRAQSEALISTISAPVENPLSLSNSHFQRALKGFIPASLRNVTLQSSTTTFDSIGGLHKTRKVLLETLQYPTTYAPLFAQCPLRLRSGLLLYGYPGCGKTLLASAVAGECGLNFISVKGPEILNKYIGASEKSVRDLFERAEAARPCVLFFDEFDSVAPKRGHDSTGVTDRVVNQLLTQMDGAEGLEGVYVLAATSRPDLIDPALLRPGRLDKSLLCDLPSLEDRLDILQALAKKLTLDPCLLDLTHEVENLNDIAKRTEGFSGADLQAVMYNAHLEAIHDILGKQSTSGRQTNGENGKEKGRNGVEGRTRNDFLSFRFGDTAPVIEEMTPAKRTAENALLAAKLENLKLAKRKERHARHALRHQVTGRHDPESAAQETPKQEVMIRWPHIEASLATTRGSISGDERRRLESIYREFVVGRSGEMRDGEGGREVGGRSSLM